MHFWRDILAVALRRQRLLGRLFHGTALSLSGRREPILQGIKVLVVVQFDLLRKAIRPAREPAHRRIVRFWRSTPDVLTHSKAGSPVIVSALIASSSFA